MGDRQIKAVAEAIWKKEYGPYIPIVGPLEARPESVQQRYENLAAAAIEASDAKYVSMLVEAFIPLMRVTSSYLKTNDDPIGRQIFAVAQMAIQKLPKEYR